VSRDETDAPGVVLEPRVVQPGRSREKRGILICHLPP
jgi:hypothetical protein